MRWRKGDFLKIASEEQCLGIAFTSNSVLKHTYEGFELVQGAGAAKNIRDSFPGSAVGLGQKISLLNPDVGKGIQPDYFCVGIKYCCTNHVCDDDKCIYQHRHIVAVQTKRNWKDKGDWDLTVNSVKSFSKYISDQNIRYVLNCPLIGLGGFANEKDRVYSMIEEILNKNDVIVCTLD